MSARQQSLMFVKALKDCQNNSLELVRAFSLGRRNLLEKPLWKLDVTPILNYNIERRCFQENVNENHDARIEQLVRALILANETNNHHLCFWLVRSHAGDLCCGVGGTE
jgi:hypothetical protein